MADVGRRVSRTWSARGVVLFALLGLWVGLVSGCDAGTRVLAEDEGWQLAVVARPGGDGGPGLQLRQEHQGRTSAHVLSGYDRPASLNSATSFGVRRNGETITLVVGPVHDGAGEVRVESATGDRVEARLNTVHGLNWFWAEVPGAQAIANVTAHDVDGELLDEYTLPPMPPPDSPTDP